jgi:DNA-binding transcriptional MerR regulator
MRVGEVAERAGVNVETLRYYERRGLLPEPSRTPAGHRRYDDETVRFVRAIKEAQALGFTLAEIEDYLRLARRPGAASDAMRVRLAAKIDEIDGKLAGLRRIRGELARALGCGCDSLDHCTCGAAYLARRGREPETAAGAILHVTNGDSAGNTLRRTALGGAVLSWNDVLHEGPVPAVDPDELRDVRARFLGSCGWGAAVAIRHALERRDELLARSLAEGRHIVLWFEHDLYDQLQLLQVLALVGDADLGRVELLQVGTVDGRPDFHGLGELEAAELESLWGRRVALTPDVAALGREGWDAFRARDPAALAGLVERDTSALPFLAAALRRLLEELPDADAGLSRSERQLLEILAEGERGPTQLFLDAQAREEAPFEGDSSCWRRIAQLGSGERPLLAPVEGDELGPPPPLGDPRRFATAQLGLTDEGRAVLAGRADRVELLGIDRWLGGTHLEPGRVWRRDRETGRIMLAS